MPVLYFLFQKALGFLRWGSRVKYREVSKFLEGAGILPGESLRTARLGNGEPASPVPAF